MVTEPCRVGIRLIKEEPVAAIELGRGRRAWDLAPMQEFFPADLLPQQCMGGMLPGDGGRAVRQADCRGQARQPGPQCFRSHAQLSEPHRLPRPRERRLLKDDLAPTTAKPIAVPLITQGSRAARRTDVVAYDTVQTDDGALAARPQFQGEIDVFAAIFKGDIKASRNEKIGPAHEAAGGRDRENSPRAAGARRQAADVIDLAVAVNGDAGMLDGAVRHPALHVAHETNPGTVERGQHWGKPSRRKYQVVVEQREHITARFLGTVVAGGGKAKILLVMENPERK